MLLTLGIIGIVAALTIPQLIQNSNNKELVAGFLKTQNVLSNALKQAEAMGDSKVYKLADKDAFKAFYEPYLKTNANCDTDVCLADGSKITYGDTFYSGCTNAVEGSSSALQNSCIKLTVDVNGKKGPNRDGKDIYNLWVTRNGVFPEGNSDSCSGLDCGAYVLAHHKIWDGETSQSSSGGGEDPELLADLQKYEEIISMDPVLSEPLTSKEELAIDLITQTMCNGYYKDGICTSCESPYTLTKSGKCILLVGSGLDGCASSNSRGECLSCSEGFVLTQDGVCSQMSGCTSSSEGHCTSCGSGYFYDPESTNCVTMGACSAWNVNGTCTACSGNRTLIKGRCYSYSNGTPPCPNNYIAYNGRCYYSGNFSSMCAGGTYNLSDSSAPLCSACSNYYIKNSDGVCIQSVSNCKTPVNGQCAECYDGYKLTSNHYCTPVMMSCYELANDGTCTTCYDEYHRDSHGLCSYYRPNCETVDPNTGNCTSCRAEWFELVNGNCVDPWE